ncbi:hypothetical protein, partial [Sphingomonas sp. PP-CC-3G-468]|uniref:hypothetical protein n=1 Tax=Sphingomonas sp. PP-CC-3G-468 TaxID=2135656 RepID=UPI0010F2016C
VEKQYLYFRRLPIPQTGALAAAESGLRLLTQTAIEKRTLRASVQLPNFGRLFIFTVRGSWGGKPPPSDRQGLLKRDPIKKI